LARPPFGDAGAFGLGDAGRVWVAWRRRRDHTLSLAVAKSPERTAVYARAGFMF
jgi:hypothetical protein